MAIVQQFVCENAWQLEMPTFISLGECDEYISRPFTCKVINTMKTTDTHVYQGAYHDVREDLPETIEEYTNDLRKWICKEILEWKISTSK